MTISHEDGIVVGLDASRNRSGGAVAHMIGLIRKGNPFDHGIRQVHVWAYKSLLDQIPDAPWLVKHNPPELQKSLLRQIFWQIFSLPTEVKRCGVDIIFNTCAGSVSTVRPSVTLSQDMLSYERGEMKRYGWSKARLRLILLKYIQNRSLTRSEGAIFLTQYAADVIQEHSGPVKSLALIPHGVGDDFKSVVSAIKWPQTALESVELLYVSNAAPYKHQWMVVRAVQQLRSEGYNVKLTMVGGGKGAPQKRLQEQMQQSDPGGVYIKQYGFCSQQELLKFLSNSHIFVFASSCENLPITLLEGMAAGLPIASSDRGPMKEVLRDGGLYFDPERPEAIANAIRQLIDNRVIREKLADRAKQIANDYSWEKCSNDTWAFLAKTFKQTKALSSSSPEQLTTEDINTQDGRYLQLRTPRYRVCTSCVMDTTDTMIRFDEKGVCDHCNTFFNVTLPAWDTGTKGRIQLDEMVSRIKKEGEGKDFDCIIGMSGGIDSSYLTYLAKEKMGLRPLVFHVDAGWNSQIAVNNIERLVDGLGLDLFTEVINWQEMRDLQLAFFKSGVPHIDTPQDHAFFATMYKFATKHNVKYILTGANLSTECIRNPIEWMYYQSDSAQLLDIHEKFGTRRLETFPVTSILWHKVWLPYFRGIQVLRPLNYAPYIKEQAKNELMNRFGWQPYPQKHFESRFTKFYEGYWLPKRFGFDVRRVQFSSLIVTGQMTRDEALELLEKPSYDETTIGQEIEFVANKLGITVDELNSYMTLPKKSYRDYRNQRYLYDMGARVMQGLGLEIGGKR